MSNMIGGIQRRRSDPLRVLAGWAERGVFRREAAHGVGLSDDQLRRLVAKGVLERAGVNAFRFPGGGHGALGDLVALMLDIGGEVWASGRTAAALHGFDGFTLGPPFDVTIRRGRDVGRVGHRVHTTTSLPPIDRARRRDIPVTSAARTLIDLARMCGPDELTAALDSALRDGFVSEDHLHRRIVALRGSGRVGMGRLLDVIEGSEATRGGHSWLEREFLRLVARAGLPRPTTQAVLTRTRTRLVRVDCRFAGSPVVVELLGYRYHRTRSQMANDAARLNALVLDGFRPLQFAYQQVVDTPDDVIADVRVALELAAVA